MADHNDFGRWGEELAASFLKENDYEILERNWISGKSEVDIIAKKDDVLTIVEVKTRSTIVFGRPQEFVNPKKINLIVKAVDEYVRLKNLDFNIRFDIIAVSGDATKYEIEHLQDAFYFF